MIRFKSLGLVAACLTLAACVREQTPPSAATRNMRSISDIGAPGVYALPNPIATAPCANPSRRIASIAAIWRIIPKPAARRRIAESRK